MAENETNEIKTAHLISKDGENWFPGISDYAADLEDIDAEETARSEEGVMFRKLIRQKVIKLSVKHKSESYNVTKIAKEIGSKTVELTVFCPASELANENGFVSSEFYVSKISTRLISLSGKSWWEVSYNAIQV